MSQAGLTIAKKTSLALTSLAVLVAGIGGFTYWQNAKTGDAMKWNNHTYQVLEKIDDVRIDLVNQEAAVRGYLLTEDKAFLPRYHSNQKAGDDSIQAIKALTSDNAAQQQRVAELQATVESWHL